MLDIYVDTIKEAYRENGAALLAYAAALHLSREAAEDAVQDVFAHILKSRPRVDDWRPYLFRAVRNACLDGRRSQKRAARGQEELQFLEADTVDMRERLAIEDALGRLSANHRECIVLKIYMGFTFTEIGGLVVPPGPATAPRDSGGTRQWMNGNRHWRSGWRCIRCGRQAPISTPAWNRSSIGGASDSRAGPGP